jgi:AcrR family transcriptional regulator
MTSVGEAGRTGAAGRPRTGRRPGPSSTRADILAAARECFAQRGYAATSVRAIAAKAGVDAALVHRFFGSKDELLVATLASAMRPAERVPELVEGDLAGLDERIVRYFLSVWERSPSREVMIAMVRSAATHEHAAELLREFIGREVLGPIAGALDGDDAPLRASLVGSQLLGVAMVRYVVKIEPLASAPPDVVAKAVAPTLRRYLTADLG